MHTHTSKGARAQGLERLQNTTHGPIHLQNNQKLYKRGCIGPFDFFVQHSLYGYSLGRRKGNSYALVPFPTIYKYEESARGTCRRDVVSLYKKS